MTKVGLTNRWQVLRSLRSRPFALLWVGQSISILGDGVSGIALVWLVLLLTGSATAMGLVIAVQIIPTVALLLIGGVIADRFPRRLVMLWSDGGRALVTFLIVGLGWFRLLHLWHLLALVLIFGIVDSFFSPVYNAIMPQLVSTDDLSSANALTAFSRQMGRLLGPLLGAACVTLVGPVIAFAFDGLTFVVSALCLLALRLPNTSLESLPSSETSDETSSGGEQPVASSSTKSNLRTLMADIGEGLHYVTSSTWLWVTILVASLANIGFFGPMTVALPKLVHDVLGAREGARQKSIEVFCCYAREDQPLLRDLKKHLMPLQREGLITLWADIDINAGEEWEKEIHRHLNAAQIILLLISPDFMDSEYCYSVEVRRALERHERGEVRVIPIVLRPVLWQKTPIGKLQALPTDANPITSGKWHNQDEAFYDVAGGIREAVEARLAEEERVRKAREDRRRQAEAERTRLAEEKERARLAKVERVKKAEEEQERLRRAEEERRRQAEEETKADQAEEGRIELRPGTREEEARWFQRLDWKALRDHRLLMERVSSGVSSEEVQRFQRLDNAVRAWLWYSFWGAENVIYTVGTREELPNVEEVVRAWMEENPGFQLEHRTLGPSIMSEEGGQR